MPQLPSGRHVAFRHELPDGPHDADRWAAMQAIETVQDLAPFIHVDLFREPTRFDHHRRETQAPLAPGSHRPPEELLPYPSGHTLAELDALTAHWSEDDVRALHEFLAGERFQGHLRDLLRQLHIATGRVEPTFVDVVLYNPEVRALYESSDD